MSQPSPANDAVLTALRQTLEKEPGNEALWLHYIDMLADAGRSGDALIAARAAREHVADRWTLGKKMVRLLRDTGEVAEATARAETLLDSRDDAELRLDYARLLLDQGLQAAAATEYAKARAAGLSDPELESLTGATPVIPPSRNPVVPSHMPVERERAPLGLDGWDEDLREELSADDPRARASLSPDEGGSDRWAAGLDWGNLFVTFQDVAGLQDIKNQINLRIIAPFKSPEIYRAFKRTAGGGILLYGPPGCGKTFLARATAGECGARFLSVGIHEMIDQFWGQSEKLMHALFEEARRRSPTVIFFDEFDALGSQRGRTESQFWKTLVDQLLQEMDGMTGRNDDLLIFAATNVPWNVDSAFRRPGRFDRVMLVPPPDETAREAILRAHAGKLPGHEQLNVAKLAKQTPLFTGADLTSLCQRASERALSRSLETGRVHPVLQDDFERELGQMQSSAQEWIATARNYARYSNEGGQYDELVDFLKRVKKW